MTTPNPLNHTTRILDYELQMAFQQVIRNFKHLDYLSISPFTLTIHRGQAPVRC